jgi:hypothetical protein
MREEKDKEVSSTDFTDYADWKRVRGRKTGGVLMLDGGTGVSPVRDTSERKMRAIPSIPSWHVSLHGRDGRATGNGLPSI